MNHLPVPNDLGLFALLNDALCDAAAGDSFGASTGELYLENLKDRRIARDMFLINGWEQARDALSNVLCNLINNLRREYGDVMSASGNGSAAGDRN